MAPRPDWNRRGPTLPAWFRLQLRRIDRRLTLQFIPPSTEEPEGVPAEHFPHGVWYLCGRMPRTRWLIKRAVYALVDRDGKLIPPDQRLMQMLRMARRLRRRGRFADLERDAEAAVRRCARDRRLQCREGLMERMAGTLRKMNVRTYARPRVFVPG
jgi:hypothetical protein